MNGLTWQCATYVISQCYSLFVLLEIHVYMPAGPLYVSVETGHQAQVWRGGAIFGNIFLFTVRCRPWFAGRDLYTIEFCLLYSDGNLVCQQFLFPSIIMFS